MDQPVNGLLNSAKLSRAIVLGHLSQGFRLPGAALIVITFDEIFGTHKRHSTVARKHPSHFLTSLSELKQDDFVVHLDHGIGVYRGLKFLTVAGVQGEFLHLEYEAGDRLYLPVDRINVVQKYIGGDGAQPSLDKLGGTSWERVKAKARKSIFAMAEELIQLYAVKLAKAMLLPRRMRFTGNLKPVSNLKKRTINSASSTSPLPICSDQSPWTGWYAAMLVSVRQRLPCGPPFLQSKVASRWPCWRQRRFWRNSIYKHFAIASAIIRCGSKWSAVS
jgi:hypothetical protein